jgi:tryptophan synthase beta chain
VACTGGGSNFGGLTFPILREKMAGKMNPVIRAVEPSACPSLTKGKYCYDYGDTAGESDCQYIYETFQVVSGV